MLHYTYASSYTIGSRQYRKIRHQISEGSQKKASLLPKSSDAVAVSYMLLLAHVACRKETSTCGPYCLPPLPPHHLEHNFAIALPRAVSIGIPQRAGSEVCLSRQEFVVWPFCPQWPENATDARSLLGPRT